MGETTNTSATGKPQPPKTAQAMGEFDLIDAFFRQPALQAQKDNPDAQIIKGIGDDCAILAPAPGMQLAISSDMLVQGRHFLPDVDPFRLGHKALAVNLSDLAAAGAQPLGFTLAMALPEVQPAWLERFSQGLLALAHEARCPLVGGDTTKGPLNLCITVFGQVPAGQALLRSGAQVGDDIYVSGALGEARLALDVQLGQQTIENTRLREYLLQRIEMPQPRLALGQALCGVATAAIDLSDGLAGDLRHILARSNVGAEIDADAVRQTSAIWADAQLATWSDERQRFFGLSGGDDYELAFTAPVSARAAVQAAAARSGTAVHRIGRIVAGQGLVVHDAQGRTIDDALESFDHFKSPA